MAIGFLLGTALYTVAELAAIEGIAKPALKTALEPVTKHITAKYNTKKADMEIQTAFEAVINARRKDEKNINLDDDNSFSDYVKRLGLSTLLSDKNDELRTKFAIELIYFTEGSTPSETIRNLLKWPDDQIDELSLLLSDLRENLVKIKDSEWEPIISYANSIYTHKKLEKLESLDDIHIMITEMFTLLKNVIIKTPDGKSHLSVVLTQMDLSAYDVNKIKEDYLESLSDQLKMHNFKGIAEVDKYALPLEDIYVELGFLPLKDRDEQLTLRKKMIILDPDARNEFAEERMNNRVLDVLKNNQQLVILGDPGAGKSIYLQYVALMLATGKGITNLNLDENYIPLRAELSKYANALSINPDLSLANYLFDYIRNKYSSSTRLEEFLRIMMDKGKCLFLLDGLDELSTQSKPKTASHDDVVDNIRNFAATWVTRKNNRIIISSRIDGYWDDPLIGFTHVELSELCPPDEVKSFLLRWLSAYKMAKDPTKNLQKANAIAEKTVRDLLPRILSIASMRRMAVNPLLLTILAIINENRGKDEDLPENRITLYKVATKTLIDTWRKAQNDMEDKLDFKLKKDEKIIRIMASLAYWLNENHPNGTTSIGEWESKLIEILHKENLGDDADELTRRFLEHAQYHTGILTERSDKQFGFYHLTFEEYFAAWYVAKQNTDKRKKIIKKHWTDPRWKEVFVLAAGQLGIEDKNKEAASGYLLDILQMEPLAPEDNGRPAFLAGSAFADIGYEKVNKFARRSVKDELVFAAKDIDPETKKFNIKNNVTPNMRVNCADLVDELGHQLDNLYSFVLIQNETNTDFWMARYPVTNIQYQRFLKSENFTNKKLWIDFPVFSAPDENGHHEIIRNTGNEGWDWLQTKLEKTNDDENKGISHPSWSNSSAFGIKRKYAPVVDITWWEANAYCRWLLHDWDNQKEGKQDYPTPVEIRLPNENEWIFAGKNAENGLYPWGNLQKEEDIIYYANTYESNIDRTTPVWMYDLGQSQMHSIMDLIGNVWEWQCNYYNCNPYFMALRGGSWDFSVQRSTRCDNRLRYLPNYFNLDVGFRIVLSISSSAPKS